MTQFFPFSPFSTRNVTAWLCLAVLKAGFFLNPYSAVASCVESRIAVAASAPLFERKITAAWQTTPPCNVVESGLMIGRSPTGLAPVGTPLYASAEVYQQEVVSTDPGTYWIAAYARDEEGAVIQSPPFPVHIVSPPTSSLGPGGSHGPPPSYSGTDADFLIPAGEPHFASIKSLSRQNSIEDTFNTLVLDFGFRQIVDTQRGLVLSGQLQPIQARAGTVAFDGGQISSALDFYDRIYIPPAFPRKGIYAVFCNYSAFPSISTGCSDMGFVNSLFLQYTNDAATSTHPQTGTTMTRQIDSSTVSLFIPALPTGKRLVSAKLRASFVAVGSAQSSSTIVLNGQPPESAVTFSCTSGSGAFAGLTECSGVATWDFTSAANSLAAQGGGQLTIQPQISSPFTGTIFIPDEGNPASGTTSEVSFSSLGMPLSVNYPWKHAREDGSLTLVFEAACTPTLQVTVTPESVLPQRAGIAGPTQATVETRVQGCPDQTPGSVVVTLQMDPDLPVAGSSDAGGHNPPHRGVRPKGSFDVPNGPSTTQCTATVDASGAGSCSVNYFASEVSGKETGQRVLWTPKRK